MCTLFGGWSGVGLGALYSIKYENKILYHTSYLTFTDFDKVCVCVCARCIPRVEFLMNYALCSFAKLKVSNYAAGGGLGVTALGNNSSG